MIGVPSGPSEKGDRMAFLYRLETADGLTAEPSTHKTAVPNWREGDTIPLGHRTLRVVAIRDDDADELPVQHWG